MPTGVEREGGGFYRSAAGELADFLESAAWQPEERDASLRSE
jgi:hypothetical protein